MTQYMLKQILFTIVVLIAGYSLGKQIGLGVAALILSIHHF